MKRKKKQQKTPNPPSLFPSKSKRIMQDLLQKHTFAVTVPTEGSKGERYRNNLKGTLQEQHHIPALLQGFHFSLTPFVI